ncbi:hypothetical protein HDU67_007444 [Dinochytrium kinnereticum]|nr:hypothetical protein HDU67_007444 [Dinochytrium kinnereticum]
MVKIAALSAVVVFAAAVAAGPVEDIATAINAVPACVKTCLSSNGITVPATIDAAAAAGICQAVARLSDPTVSGPVLTCVSADAACADNAVNLPTYVTGLVPACGALAAAAGATDLPATTAAAATTTAAATIVPTTTAAATTTAPATTKPSSADRASIAFAPLAAVAAIAAYFF